MQQTANQGYNLVENTDEIQTSLNAWNGNFNKLDASITSVENGVEALTDNYDANTVEGTDLYITDSASAPIKDISIGENSEITQDEEPTPEDEVDVNVVEGNITLVDQSKNIVDWGNPLSLVRTTLDWENDVLTVVGEGGNTLVSYDITQFFKSHAGKKIYFGYEELDTSAFHSSSTTIAQLQLSIGTEMSYISMATSGGSKTLYTIPEDISNINYARFRIITNNTSTETTSKLVITKPQLEPGEVSTSYVKYGKQSYPITLPNGMFLGKMGNASNYIYGDIDNWKLHKALAKKVIDGTENWSSTATAVYGKLRWVLKIADIKMATTTTDMPNIKSSFYQAKALGGGSGTYNNIEGISASSTNNSIIIYDENNNTSLDAFKTMLAEKYAGGTPLEVYYEIETALDEPITDVTLIEQLNTIKRNMTTYKDGTIIFTVTDVLKPSIKLTYGLNPEIETNEKVAKVQSELDMLKSNFDVKTSPNSDNMNITDAINDYNQGNIKIGDGTELTQETTNGYNILPVTLDSNVINGLTVTVNSDKSITLNGTTTGAISLNVFEGNISLNGAFKFYLYGKSGKINLQGTENNSAVAYLTYAASSQYATRTYSEDTTLTKIYSYIAANTTFNNETFKYMITKGDDIYEYEQYTNGASPNPSYPQPINVVEGECGIEESTENLFDKNSATTQVGYFRDTGEIASGGNSTITTSYTRIVPNVDYTISGFIFQSMCFYDANHNFIKRVIGINSSSYTFNENAYYIRIQGQTINFNLDVLKLEQGLIANPYVPHKGKSFDITLPEGMFLGKIGDVSNYIYGTKDNWKIHSGLDKVVFDENTGNLTIVNEKNNSIYFEQSTVKWKKVTASNVANIMCNILSTKSANSMYNTDVEGITVGNPSAGVAKTRFNLLKTRASSVAELKTWLGTHNMIIYGELNEPTETDITDTTLIQQLNNIADNLQTYKGGTVVFTSGESLAPNIQFDYLQNPLSSIEARLDLLEA